ncbi:MAG: DUF3052 domain-containing protein [Lewinellaceae bacterium]|nr:DUF3052 domain-containing protein [Lewinellaceae bacterium]
MTLREKLNAKNYSKVYIENVPSEVLEMIEGEGFEILDDISSNPMSFVVTAGYDKEDFEKSLINWIGNISDDPLVWLCYPKKSSKKYKSELSRETMWDILGSYNMEPVRQIAIDEDWSAIRYRMVNKIKSLTRTNAATREGKNRIKSQ